VRRKSARGQAGETQTFGTTMDDGAIVLGNVELTARAVTLSVNSEARAARGRRCWNRFSRDWCALPSSSGRLPNR
jgi:hypothetical protein